MNTEAIILALDDIECEMRRLEHRLLGIRRALRPKVDPFSKRKDLGFFPEDADKSEKVG